MLAWEVEVPFNSPNHLFEVKWDGYRAIAYLEGKTVLQSRSGRNISGKFPVLSDLYRSFREPAVLDGEIVAFFQGRPSFAQLQAGRGEILYLAFDLLYLGDRALLELTLGERRRLLAEGIRPGGRLLLSESVAGNGTGLYAATRELGLEGIVAKALASPYRPGRRTTDWLKVKHRRRADCVIGGYTRGRGKRIGGLLLGAYLGEKFLYRGRAGTGFSEAEAAQILARLTPRPTPPFQSQFPPGLRREVEGWSEPELVCEVEYLEVTGEGLLRQPSFITLRLDKDPRECLFTWDTGGRLSPNS